MKFIAKTKYIWRMLELFLKKKKLNDIVMNKSTNVIDNMSEATGISQRYRRNIHTEFLANDRKFLLPINCYTDLKIRINTNSFNRESIQRVAH